MCMCIMQFVFYIKCINSYLIQLKHITVKEYGMDMSGYDHQCAMAYEYQITKTIIQKKKFLKN